MAKKKSERLEFGQINGVKGNVSVSCTPEELQKLSPDQCEAFMRGLALVISGEAAK